MYSPSFDFGTTGVPDSGCSFASMYVGCRQALDHTVVFLQTAKKKWQTNTISLPGILCLNYSERFILSTPISHTKMLTTEIFLLDIFLLPCVAVWMLLVMAHLCKLARSESVIDLLTSSFAGTLQPVVADIPTGKEIRGPPAWQSSLPCLLTKCRLCSTLWTIL